jgi:hypothetical protein
VKFSRNPESAPKNQSHLEGSPQFLKDARLGLIRSMARLANGGTLPTPEQHEEILKEARESRDFQRSVNQDIDNLPETYERDK